MNKRSEKKRKEVNIYEKGKEMQPIEKSILEQAEKEGIKRFVVGAIITKEKKVLLLQRKVGEFLPQIYELCSGEVQEKEILEEALRREIKEETGLKVIKISKYFNSFDYKSSSGEKTRQFNFIVEVEKGEVKLNLEEHDDFIWIEPTRLGMYKITESVQKTLKELWEKKEN